MLGRHVSGSSDRHASGGQSRVASVSERTSDAEIRHHRTSGLVVDDDVVRLDITVDDVAIVRVSERFGDFSQNATHLYGWHWTVLLQAHAEVVALDVRHDEVDEIVALFDGVDRNDVRVIQLGRGLGFAQESLTNVGAEAQLRRQHFDRDLALQPFVTRAVHDAHAATTHFVL